MQRGWIEQSGTGLAFWLVVRTDTLILFSIVLDSRMLLTVHLERGAAAPQ